MNEPRIKILPEDLINKIAAGEVVERPASVVKELVENSIDAGATQIVVEVQDAGKKLIRVSDNGSGMTEEEIKIALERHSTSKISSTEDLFNIKTLGFRGEALPSIASVSKLRIEPNPSGAGVTVESKDLFYNVPARKKFLKSDATEVGHIGEFVSKYAMAYPQIAFKLVSDGKALISSSGNGKLIDAILSIYGAELARELIEIDSQFQPGRIFGFASRPTLSRIDKNYETFYVNGRFVRNFLLNRALEEAYRTLIPGNRYPVGVLFIDIDPRQVDVNVHPTKREVKFLKTQEVMNAVTAAVAKGLADFKEYQNIRVSEGEDQKIRISEKPEMMDVFFPIVSQSIELEVTAVQPLIPIYQFKQTYIIATDGEELMLIDQHAAHERILYDRLGHESRVTDRQSLLIPETLELRPSEAIVLKENINYLKDLGFDLEEFGGNSFILRSIPAISSKVPVRQLLIDIVSELQASGKSVELEVKRENIRKLIACHSAVKAGDSLTREEMNQLIKDLYATQNPLTCPHGRPTMVQIGEAELKKRFGR